MNAPAPFPSDQLRPTDGLLDAAIRWGGEEQEEPLLLHRITVPLAPLVFGGIAAPNPLLRLHSIRFGVRSWRELQHRSFPFRQEVADMSKEGESHFIYDIYGSLRLGDRYHEVIPSLVEFGSQLDGLLEVRVVGALHATDTPPSFSSADIDISCGVSVGPVRVLGDAGSSEFPDLSVAAPLARRLLDLQDYGEPEVEDDCVVFAARIEPANPPS